MWYKWFILQQLTNQIAVFLLSYNIVEVTIAFCSGIYQLIAINWLYNMPLQKHFLCNNMSHGEISNCSLLTIDTHIFHIQLIISALVCMHLAKIHFNPYFKSFVPHNYCLEYVVSYQGNLYVGAKVWQI